MSQKRRKGKIMMTSYNFIDTESLREAMFDTNNYDEILNLVKGFKRFYKAEENIDRFLYNRKYWMIEEGWTVDELTAIRNRKASDCMKCLFRLNKRNHFLPFVAKENYLDCLNEVYGFINNEMNKLTVSIAV